MLTKRTVLLSLIMILAIMLSLHGCSNKPTVSPPEYKQPHQMPDHSSDNTTPTQQTEIVPDDNNDTHISSPVEVDTAEDDPIEGDDQLPDEDPMSEEDSEQEPDELLSYNPNKPMLMGLTIGQSKDRIREIFGTPIEEYIMEDPQDPITVYEYRDFLVGYDKNMLIAFIDVNSNAVNPGLNGLKLGDTIDAAIRAIGHPDTRTTYVMNYHSVDATLKLDIDPHSQTISSIKLFGIN